MDAFSKLNPKVTFIYFICVSTLTLISFNPFFLIAGFLGSFFYNIKLRGGQAVCSFFKFILPVIIFVSVFNMFFASYGESVIFSLFNRDFTFEALFYGFCQGVLLGEMIMWFYAYSYVITSDRFLAVFGRIAPNSAMIFAMVLSFIPRLKKNAQEISDAQMLIKSQGSLKKSFSNFSSLLTMTLEESIEISDSMKSRNFTSKRTVYSKYKFSFIDFIVLFIVLLLFAALILFKAFGKTEFIFEPVIMIESFSYTALVFYCIIALLPLIIDLSEDIKWHFLKQKI